jgi:hypothetical protein
MLAPLLLTWVFLGTVSTMQCHGTDCQPTRTSPAVAGPHRMAVFPSPAACEAYRHKMEQMPLPVVHSTTRPEVTVRKQITYTCAEGSEGL